MLPSNDAGTTAAVERYLGDLAVVDRECPADPIVRALLARSVGRLQALCGSLLYRSYPRLTHPPLNLQAEELLSAVVERLLKAMAKARPQNVRQFFGLANQHIRWELNDLARRLDKNEPVEELMPSAVVAPESSGSELSFNARRMLEAIENLPEAEREAFSLVRIQGVTLGEAAALMEVSLKTIQRRLNNSVFLLSKTLSDLEPGGQPCDEA